MKECWVLLYWTVIFPRREAKPNKLSRDGIRSLKLGRRSKESWWKFSQSSRSTSTASMCCKRRLSRSNTGSLRLNFRCRNKDFQSLRAMNYSMLDNGSLRWSLENSLWPSLARRRICKETKTSLGNPQASNCKDQRAQVILVAKSWTTLILPRMSPKSKSARNARKMDSSFCKMPRVSVVKSPQTIARLGLRSNQIKQRRQSKLNGFHYTRIQRQGRSWSHMTHLNR